MTLEWADHEEVVEVLESTIRRARNILYAALGDSPVIQEDLRSGDWQRLKYAALDAMHTLEQATEEKYGNHGIGS